MAWGDLSTGQKFTGGLMGGSMLGGGIASLLGGGENPAFGANKFLNQIPGQMKQYLDPYINAGTSELPGYQDFLHQIMTDPNGFLNKLGAGYQKSPGYDFNLQQGQSAISNANAAGGLLGTPQHEQQAGQLANQLASQDYDNYMQRIMQTLGMGQQGTAGLIGQGAGAAGDLASALAQVLGQKAQYSYAGQAGQNQAQSGGIGNILGGLGGLLGAFL